MVERAVLIPCSLSTKHRTCGRGQVIDVSDRRVTAVVGGGILVIAYAERGHAGSVEVKRGIVGHYYWRNRINYRYCDVTAGRIAGSIRTGRRYNKHADICTSENLKRVTHHCWRRTCFYYGEDVESCGVACEPVGVQGDGCIATHHHGSDGVKDAYDGVTAWSSVAVYIRNGDWVDDVGSDIATINYECLIERSKINLTVVRCREQIKFKVISFSVNI